VSPRRYRFILPTFDASWNCSHQANTTPPLFSSAPCCPRYKYSSQISTDVDAVRRPAGHRLVCRASGKKMGHPLTAADRLLPGLHQPLALGRQHADYVGLRFHTDKRTLELPPVCRTRAHDAWPSWHASWNKTHNAPSWRDLWQSPS